MNISCYTNTNIDHVEHKWIVPKFRVHLEKSGGKKKTTNLKSSSFSVGDSNETKWHLEIDFFGNKHAKKDFIGIYVCLDKPKKTLGVFSSQTYCLINSDNGQIEICRLAISKFDANQKRSGTDEFLKRETLIKEANLYLPNDQLTIICKIDVVGESTNTIVYPNQAKNTAPKANTSVSTNDESADVTFAFDNRKMTAHKNILIANSPIFAAMFDEGGNDVVTITDEDPVIFEKMLEYIYTNEVEGIADIAMELILTADKYGLESLKTLCELSLFDEIDVDNVVEIFLLADRIDAIQLLEFAQNFMRAHIAEVSQTPSFDAMCDKYPEWIRIQRRLSE